MTITDAFGRQMITKIRSTLRRYETHPQWDDIVSYALLRACEAIVKLPEQDTEIALGMVVYAARWSVKRFFLSQQCDLCYRHTTRAGNTLPLQLSWESLPCDEWNMTEPDFAPALIEQLAMAEFAQIATQQMTTSEQEILWRWLAGESRSEIARGVGRSKSWVSTTCQDALDRVRRSHGMALSWRSTSSSNEARRRRRAALREKKRRGNQE